MTSRRDKVLAVLGLLGDELGVFDTSDEHAVIVALLTGVPVGMARSKIGDAERALQKLRDGGSTLDPADVLSILRAARRVWTARRRSVQN